MATFELIFYNGANTIIFVDDNDSRVMSRKYEKNENYPGILTVTLDNATTSTTSNLLNSSCNLWTGGATGALGLGTNVKYSVYPTSTGSKTQVFYGKITNLAQASNGVLFIEAKDYQEKYEKLRYDAIYYKNYRDSAIKAHAISGGFLTLTGITDNTILMPMVDVRVACDDFAVSMSTSPNTSAVDIKGGTKKAAQSFIAEGDAVVAVTVAYTSAADTLGNFTCSLQADDGSGTPSGTSIISTSWADAGASVTTTIDLLDTSDPTPLVRGNLYWLVFTCTSSGGSGTSYIDAETPNNTGITTWKYYNGSSWADKSAACLEVDIHQVKYATIEPGQYSMDESTNVLTITNASNIGSFMAPSQTSYTSFYRGRVSYYYGTLTKEEIFDYLKGLDVDVGGSTSSNLDNTFYTFSTRGKTIGDCMRELANVRETSGTWSGYQSAFAHYESGGSQYLKVDKREKVGDASTFTFSNSSATDNELRIINVNLEKTSTNRPAMVKVIGKSPKGYPIVAERNDVAISGSFITAMDGFAPIEVITDENINTLNGADALAYAILDSYSRNTWQGEIEVSGVYPNAIDIDPVSDTFGSGRIITLNYSPLGISNTQFKVTGVVCKENSTIIRLNNIDDFNYAAGKFREVKRSECFLAPTGVYTNFFIGVDEEDVVTTASLYMELQDVLGNPITGISRVLCTKMSNTTYNTNTYHAEFDVMNGNTVDGSTVVGNIALYAAASGGVATATFALGPSNRFPKWKTTRVIVDYRCKAS